MKLNNVKGYSGDQSDPDTAYDDWLDQRETESVKLREGATMKAYTISPNGTVLVHNDFKYSDINLLQSIIGGYVEYVSVWYDGKPATLIVNEDGLTKGLPPNARATSIYWTATILGKTGVAFNPLTDPLIVGNAVLLPISKSDL